MHFLGRQILDELSIDPWNKPSLGPYAHHEEIQTSDDGSQQYIMSYHYDENGEIESIKGMHPVTDLYIHCQRESKDNYSLLAFNDKDVHSPETRVLDAYFKIYTKRNRRHPCLTGPYIQNAIGNQPTAITGHLDSYGSELWVGELSCYTLSQQKQSHISEALEVTFSKSGYYLIDDYKRVTLDGNKVQGKFLKPFKLSVTRPAEHAFDHSYLRAARDILIEDLDGPMTHTNKNNVKTIATSSDQILFYSADHGELVVCHTIIDKITGFHFHQNAEEHHEHIPFATDATYLEKTKYKDGRMNVKLVENHIPRVCREYDANGNMCKEAVYDEERSLLTNTLHPEARSKVLNSYIEEKGFLHPQLLGTLPLKDAEKLREYILTQRTFIQMAQQRVAINDVTRIPS